MSSHFNPDSYLRSGSIFHGDWSQVPTTNFLNGHPRRKGLDNYSNVLIEDQTADETRLHKLGPLALNVEPTLAHDTETPSRPIDPNTVRPRKKQRRQSEKTDPQGSRIIYPRKRAVTACQLCRTRKSKCDNQRPSCTSCSQLAADCKYSDAKSDHSSFDPASLAIIDKLNHVVNLLEQRSHRGPAGEFSDQWLVFENAEVLQPSGEAMIPEQLQETSRSLQRQERGGVLDGSSDNTIHALDSSGLATYFHGNAENTLDWPIFKGEYDSHSVERLIFDPLETANSVAGSEGIRGPNQRYLSKVVNPRTKSSGGRGVREEDIIPLTQSFLANVHIKNPILNPKDLVNIAKDVAENGFGWDSESCLIYITCALGTISRKFELNFLSPLKPENPNSLMDVDDYTTAESYYTASRKRIGLLNNSLLATQCYFLSGVYEMYSLRPFTAWTSFNRACVNFQTVFRARSPQMLSQGHLIRSQEHRLYWTCLKSEFEIRREINMPPSGITGLSYPNSSSLPSPPTLSPTTGSLNQEEESFNELSPSSSGLEPAVERSWYYYLAEIAARQIRIRILNSFYKSPPSVWLVVPIDQLVLLAREYEAQIVQWNNHIPFTSLNSENERDDELSSLLQGRACELRENIYYPFTYIAIHHPGYPARNAEDKSDQGRIPTIIDTFVQKHLEACILGSKFTMLRYRHHGSWYGARQSYSNGLILLAAAKSCKISLPRNWREAVENSITTLRYWEEEAPDLKAARGILSKIYNEVVREQGLCESL